jgi:predicted nucleic acid-binding protein
MVTCCDTSLLFALYGNDAHSTRAIGWVRKQSQPISLSPFNEYELANALRFAEYHGTLRPGDAAACWADFEADLTAGRLATPPCNLAAVVAEAKRLSASHTLSSGHRSFDILHVATAVHLGAKRFLTFDRNQRVLAKAERLALPL